LSSAHFVLFVSLTVGPWCGSRVAHEFTQGKRGTRMTEKFKTLEMRFRYTRQTTRIEGTKVQTRQLTWYNAHTHMPCRFLHWVHMFSFL
jgi:hypothetical protein